ncbi:MAG TPA: penicillin-binding transpeptidase domain-containing protein, partial [Chroococcales cyanobacterium]
MGRRDTIRTRLTFVYGVLALGGVLLMGRLIQLQVFEAPRLSALAVKQRTRELNLSSIRGEIVDRSGEELAVSIDAYSIYAHPSEFTLPPAEIAAKLAPVLGESPSELLEKMEGPHWRWLLRQKEEKLAKEVSLLKLDGIGVIKESKRVYPKGTLAAPLLGFVGVDNQGLAGIEHAFDKVLAGPPKKLEVSVDAHGREILRENTESPLRTILTDGAQVVLTLDESLQHIADRELAASIKNFEAKRGAALVMDPSNGDILAFAIQPTYDPNEYQKADWGRIKNWAVSDVYEPGSTM